MAARCREGLGEGRGRFRYVAMDGERPCFAPDVRFDLVCSSLAFQWFHDLEGAVASLCALLAPGGHLAFTPLAEGSFDEWRAAHRISETGRASCRERVCTYVSLTVVAVAIKKYIRLK